MTPQVISLSSLGSTAWIPVDYKQNPFNISIACVVSNTPNLTYQVEFTLDDIFNTSITPTAFIHDLLVGKTSDSTSNQTIPVKAVRLTTTAYVSGTVSMTLIQGVVNPTIHASNGGVMTSIGWLLSKNDEIDGLCTNTLLATTAPTNYGSGIGRVERPLGTVGTNSDRSAGADATKGLPWVDDSGYVSGSAGVTTLIGGYDHVCNQLAGTIIGGGHNYLQYNSLGHSTIVGGANNRVSGGRAAIMGGSNNTVTANVSSCFGGFSNTVNASYSTIVGGVDHVIDATATGYSGIFGGRQNTITADYAACLGGYGNTITHNQAVVLGQDGISDSVGSLTISRTKLSVVGDVQTTIHEYGWRTTNATIANMTQNFVIPAAQKTALAIHAQMVAIDEATGACAIFTWDGGMIWDGTSTATFYDAGGSGVNRNFTQIVDNIGVAALPLWSGTTGTVRPRVTGKAATNIKWSCTAIFTVTRL